MGLPRLSGHKDPRQQGAWTLTNSVLYFYVLKHQIRSERFPQAAREKFMLTSLSSQRPAQPSPCEAPELDVRSSQVQLRPGALVSPSVAARQNLTRRKNLEKRISRSSSPRRRPV